MRKLRYPHITKKEENAVASMVLGHLKKEDRAHTPVRIPIRVKRTHVVHLLKIDIGEDQLVVAAVNNRWSIRASKYISGGKRTKCP